MCVQQWWGLGLTLCRAYYCAASMRSQFNSFLLTGFDWNKLESKALILPTSLPSRGLPTYSPNTIHMQSYATTYAYQYMTKNT